MSARPSTSRRTVIKGAAWSVPVVTAAAAAPAASASTAPVQLTFSGMSGAYAERTPDVFSIDTTAIVDVASGSWPADGVTLSYRFYSPTDGIAGGEARFFTATGTDSISFPSSVGAAPGFENFMLVVYRGPATGTQVLGFSEWQPIIQLV